jgi:hypothetical protein
VSKNNIINFIITMYSASFGLPQQRLQAIELGELISKQFLDSKVPEGVVTFIKPQDCNVEDIIRLIIWEIRNNLIEIKILDDSSIKLCLPYTTPLGQTVDNDPDLLKLIKLANSYYNLVNSGHLNYWGTNGNKYAPLGCLNCSACMYKGSEFFEYGPEIGKHLYLCGKCLTEYNENMQEIRFLAKKRKYNMKKIYELCTKSVDDFIKKLENSLTNEEKKRSGWRML